MNLTEKILAAKLLPGQGSHVKPGDAVLVKVDAGYSHEFTTAQVDKFLADEYGAGYRLKESTRFAVFEDHLIPRQSWRLPWRAGSTGATCARRAPDH